jgi:hypothetical protein
MLMLCKLRPSFVLLLLLGPGASAGADLGPNTLTRWSWSPPAGMAPAHQSYAFGRAMGAQFAGSIRARIMSNAFITETLAPAFTAVGAPRRDVYASLLAANNATYPAYTRELAGIADGAGVAFPYVFLSQLMEEFTFFLPTPGRASLKEPEHCSDLSWITADGKHTYLAHNEDSGAGDLNHTALISAPMGVAGGPAFTAFTYLGNTPTGAFGWNAQRLLFTMNYVAPEQADPNGLGRVFMARDLLEMTSLQDGLERITRTSPGISAGHNYQLVDFNSGKLLNVEVAAFGRSSVRAQLAGRPGYFHANTYQTLNVLGQIGSNSSTHRDARAKVLLSAHPIQNGEEDMLAVLGDQGDRAYPIYHDNLSHEMGDQSDWTLGSIFADASEGTVWVWNTNPKTTAPAYEIKI